jgi:hypothetical protein
MTSEGASPMRARVLSIAVLALVAGCGNNSGGTDSGTGGTDSGMDAGSMACTMTGAENTAAACGNGCDDDGDTFADCNDFDCCVLVTCGPTTECGMRDAGTPPARCDGGSGMEDTVEACMNGCDDDGDGFLDCRDFDCPAAACPRDGGTPPMACDGGAGMENTLAACSDGCSNDADRFVDCDDFDCCSVRTDCPSTSSCGRDAGPPRDSGPSTACETMGPENTVEACTNMCSDDGDRFVDCDDFDCCDVLAGAGMRCTTGSCSMRM